MKPFSLPLIAGTLVSVGALVMAVGQVAALASGQFARWAQQDWDRHLKSAAADTRPGQTDGAGPGAGMGITLAFMCCVPLLFPAAYACVAVWVLRHPITGVTSRTLRVLAHAVWAAWCGAVILFCMAFGAVGEVWGPLQWEWPGFWLQSAGNWVAVAGHAAAALWHPVRDGVAATEPPFA